MTGDVHRTRASARHWLAIASREGAAGSARKPGDLRRPQAHIDPRGKGLAHHATHPSRARGARSPGRRRSTRSNRLPHRGRNAATPPSAQSARSRSASKARPRRSCAPPPSRSGGAGVVKDGKSADSCARQERRRSARARHARQLGGNVVGLLQVLLPDRHRGAWPSPRPARSSGRSGSTTRPASSGICAYTPKSGDSLLFFPDCYGKKCPMSAGVLGAKAAVGGDGRAALQRCGDRL